MTIHIALLVGSTRADSVNRRLAETLRDRFAADAGSGIELDVVDDLGGLPFYDEDLDAHATPYAARRVRERVPAADAVLAVTPEYNGSMPAVLKNAIDWLSRPYAQGDIRGKPFGVIGVTPTPYGGKWAHEHAQHSARIAGAEVVEHAVVSQSSIDVDVLTDPAVLGRFEDVLRTLAQARAIAA